MKKEDIEISNAYHALSKEDQGKFLSSLSSKAFEAFYYSNLMLLPYQRIPEGKWRYCLYLGGRGSGKSFTGAQWVADKINEGGNSVAIIGATYQDVSKIMVPAIIDRFPPGKKPKYVSGSANLLKFPDGQEIHCITYDTEGARGGNYSHIWIDEIVKACDSIAEKIEQRFQEVIDPSCRLGDAQIYLSTTPKPFPILINWVKRFEDGDPLIVVKSSCTDDNPYLADVAKQALYATYGNTRTGRQELNAELLTDVEGALWTHKSIEQDRITALEFRNKVKIERVVVGVDPSISDGSKDADACGIIVAGYAKNHAYIMADYSLNAPPDKWAIEVIKAYELFNATNIVIEVNQGGLMCEQVIRTVSRNVSITKVHAKQAKIVRAEPVAALYNQRKVSHVGYFKGLETEMTTFNGNPKQKSPNRLDALVYALKNLMLDNVYTNRDLSSIGIYA